MRTTPKRGGPAFSLASLALLACNALIGNDGASLWNADDGGSGAGIDSPTSGADAATDTGADATGSGLDTGATIDAGSDADASLLDGGSDSNSTASDGSFTPPSCAPGGPGMTNCGASGTESCCTSLEVEGGMYYRTYDSIEPDGSAQLADDGGPAGESNLASVSGFRLDEYEVTVGRFRQFVSAISPDGGDFPDDGGVPRWTPDAGSGKHAHLNGGLGLVNSGSAGGYEPGWVASDDVNIAPTNARLVGCGSRWTTTPGVYENLPIACMNWYEAYAFCIWDGGFLPSESEWEYAAAGGSQQREYPWGSSAPGPDYAIYECAFGTCAIAPVGTASAGAGAWGQLDLAGNVDEWVLDLSANYGNPCPDCAFLNGNSGRVYRGGDYQNNTTTLHPASRVGIGAPTAYGAGVGIRCARRP